MWSEILHTAIIYRIFLIDDADQSNGMHEKTNTQSLLV